MTGPADADSVGPLDAALELVGVTSGYGRITVLRDVTLTVPAGSVVALLGPNGAGKTTLLRTAAGQIRQSQGRIRVQGRDVSRSRPSRRAQAGLCLIPEGRGIFRSLTVRENLTLFTPPWAQDNSVDRAIEAFPLLGTRLRQTAGSMSGGQQQMLALARAYLCEAPVVLLDEVSMGLAPLIVDEIFASIRRLAAAGTALLLVEQYVQRAIDMADRVVLLDHGCVSFDGVPGELDEQAVLRHYLGVDATA